MPREKGVAMLILTRKVNQGIVIDGNILVQVLGIERDRVKIGISAPVEIKVFRQELLVDESDSSNQDVDQETLRDTG